MSDINYEIINKDLQRAIDDEQKDLILENEITNMKKPKNNMLCLTTGIGCDMPEVDQETKVNSDVVGRYADHKSINRWLKRLPKKYPGIAKIQMIGKSYEGRKMYMIKIGKGINERRRLKPIIFIDAGVHAREWIAPGTAIYIIDMDRLWRKTRSPQADGCFGVDPNRNFDIDFGVSGSSKDPCHLTYPGVKPFSEPETANIRDIILSKKHKIKAYLTFHSYSQMLLTPYGYTKEKAPDHKELAGIKFSYTYELRPDKVRPPMTTGFILPKTEIKPSAEEVFASLVSIAKDI
ncbi:hypothetical protein KUTeg_010758 [Tegillarca granosa]|uniref:Peptidase M14 domain-containing protein n=1 Tax=Tegillarca granosa TaxID=220873 RepID=A0ABQ9F1Y3_TEGGR|nr:hypothetical protein KUTeg_010758 [Tegillarca granosa]